MGERQKTTNQFQNLWEMFEADWKHSRFNDGEGEVVPVIVIVFIEVIE